MARADAIFIFRPLPSPQDECSVILDGFTGAAHEGFLFPRSPQTTEPYIHSPANAVDDRSDLGRIAGSLS